MTGKDTPENPAYPAKFVDPDTGELKVDSLVQSYLALERKLGTSGVPEPEQPMTREAALRALGVPETPQQYRVEILEDFLERDPELEAVLHQAGFTEDQVQLVYDLAAEKLAPVMAEVVKAARGATDTARLESHFGGKQRWKETQRQLRKWGSRTLPEEAFDALCCSYDGVLAMHRMMSAGDEPGLANGEFGGSAASEDELKRLMRDPRYWRDHDPSIEKRVSEGYRRLYPGAG